MTARRDPMVEPIKIGEFWKNRRGELVRVTLCSYEDHNLIDIRVHYTAKDGTLQPCRKGLTLAVGKLPELTAALRKAVAKAAELGLLDEGGDA
jgi:hypothetical protein